MKVRSQKVFNIVRNSIRFDKKVKKETIAEIKF